MWTAAATDGLGDYRATQDSLMYGEIPVLGSVNRHFAEQILELWGGSGS